MTAVLGTAGASAANREGDADYDIVWPWSRRQRPGTGIVLRVKDEARSLPWVLPPLLRTATEVVLVDNGSTDGTPDVARRVADATGLGGKLTVTEYPFQVSRCGPEHLYTPADSVHSLVWFYSWSFAHLSTTYSVKWDGDMVLTREGEELLRELAWRLPGREAVLYVPRHSLYVESDRVAYLDLGLFNAEPFGYPMSPAYPHVKAFEWELRIHPEGVDHVKLPEGTCLELKYLDSDEFAHWTDVDAFATSLRTRRKRREHRLFTDLVEGRWEEHAASGLHRIEVPAGSGAHVVDHVTEVWLPAAPRPLVDPALRRLTSQDRARGRRQQEPT
ncbi:hypothetical protein [uncultured Nocardioides sp.]|uniref:hypothetical protein n=1 Tax=uncultured Nocardioides sp. TaxID=198441 RepID=UPI002639028C|nr:hypothetical protein [uncultured Nocardioides sp.]